MSEVFIFCDKQFFSHQIFKRGGGGGGGDEC